MSDGNAKFVQITSSENGQLHALDEDGDVWMLPAYGNKWIRLTDTREWKRL